MSQFTGASDICVAWKKRAGKGRKKRDQKAEGETGFRKEDRGESIPTMRRGLTPEEALPCVPWASFFTLIWNIFNGVGH